MTTVHQRYRQTDGQTTYEDNTAQCSKNIDDQNMPYNTTDYTAAVQNTHIIKTKFKPRCLSLETTRLVKPSLFVSVQVVNHSNCIVHL